MKGWRMFLVPLALLAVGFLFLTEWLSEYANSFTIKCDIMPYITKGCYFIPPNNLFLGAGILIVACAGFVIVVLCLKS